MSLLYKNKACISLILKELEINRGFLPLSKSEIESYISKIDSISIFEKYLQALTPSDPLSLTKPSRVPQQRGDLNCGGWYAGWHCSTSAEERNIIDIVYTIFILFQCFLLNLPYQILTSDFMILCMCVSCIICWESSMNPLMLFDSNELIRRLNPC